MALFASTAGWSLDLFDLFLLLFVAPTIGSLFSLPQIPLCLWPVFMLRSQRPVSLDRSVRLYSELTPINTAVRKRSF